MKKIIPLLFISSFVFAQPKSIHFSALGDYLVDQDGNKTHIEGYPEMICYQKYNEIKGTFEKAEGATIWLSVRAAFFLQGPSLVKIEYPVCDLK